MGEVQLITGPGRAELVAQGLNRPRRTRPAAVVSIATGAPRPWIDADRLATELDGLADVYVLQNAECSWAFSSAMPSGTQVYGGAGRVYPAGLDWVHDPARSRIRFAYSAGEGEAATTRLIEDGLAAALRAGALVPAPRAASDDQVVGLVKGCPTTSQALVAVPGGYASIQMGVALPGVPSDRVFAVGMEVRGRFDQETRRLDVRGFLPDPAARLAEVTDGDVLWGRVESVDRHSCAIAPYPGVAIRVPWEEITTTAADDLHDLVSVGEIVAVRATRGEDRELGLSLAGFDETNTPCSALAVFPGGPPWLVPPEPATSPPDRPVTSDTPVAAAVTVPERPRPTPLLIGRQRDPRRADAPPPADPGPGTSAGGREALRSMSLQLEAARSTVNQLETALRAGETRLRSAQAELTLLERDMGRQARELAAREEDLRRLRARIRKNVQEERRLAGRREAAPGEDLFLDAAEQFDFDVRDRWARRIPAADKADKPLRAYRFGPRFLGSLRAVEGVDRAKVADVVVDILTGLAENSAGRDMHPLRSGAGGDDEVLRRDGYTCWRVAIQRRTPQARRLHFWRSADDIELSRVVVHDDFEP
jgi:hypothetical protein